MWIHNKGNGFLCYFSPIKLIVVDNQSTTPGALAADGRTR
jgi:hypothetical protein